MEKGKREMTGQTTLTGKRTLLTRKRILLTGKRTLLIRKRILLTGKGTFLTRKRIFMTGKRTSNQTNKICRSR